MIASTSSGLVPKVGGISADSSTPSRPLVPAPTKMMRPPRRSACVMISTPHAIRSFSRCTAASILRSSFIIPSTMSPGESLSMARVEGLIASVGRDCHFDRPAITERPRTNGAWYHESATCRLCPDMIAAFLDHLRAERRLADHTIESYARDLTALARYAAGEERPLDALDRHALEAFVRQQMTSGLSPRSVARSIAAIRGFYRFLVLDRRLERNPADDLTPPRAWPALPKFLSVEEVDHLIAQPDVSTPLGLRD